MKKDLHILMMLAAVFACGKLENAPSPQAEAPMAATAGTGTVYVGLGGPFLTTRTANPAATAETDCSRWAIWLFDADGDGVAYGTAGAGESIRKTLPVGSYTAIAVVNYPGSLIPGSVTGKTELKTRVMQLHDNAAGAMIMYGEASVELGKDQTVSCTVDVRRLVAKVGVKKVSVAFENPYLAAKTTVLEAIYLTNLYRSCRLGSDYTAEQLSSWESAWYNVMGWRPAEDAVPGMDALVGDMDIQAVLTPSAPYTTPHYFYAYPNATPADADTHDPVWSKRSTRLVLQVAVGSNTYYYQVQIPAMGRNRIYVAEEIILKKPGSKDPEQEIPGAVDVVFSAVGTDWDRDVTVTENT